MAADLTQSFMGKHVEKVVLGVAALVFVGAVAWFVVMRDNQGALLNKAKNLVAEAEKKRGEASLDKALTMEERVRLGIDEPGTGVAQFKDQVASLPAPYEPAVKMVAGLPRKVDPGKGKTVIEVVRAAPERILPVTDLQIVWGRGVTSDTVPAPLATVKGKTSTLSDIVWVGVAGKVDLTDQLAANTSGDRSAAQPIIFTKVELQRREMKPDGTWSDWALTAPAGAPAVVGKLPARPENPQQRPAVAEYYVGLSKMQADVRRLPFYTLVVTDAEGKTIGEAVGPVKGAEQPSLKAPEAPKAEAPKPAEETAATAPAEEEKPKARPSAGGVPDWLQQIEKGPTKGPAVAATEEGEPLAQHVYATVWANDASVEPGKTYQYQMRVAMFNPVYSDPTVKEEADRWKLDFESPWSEPTETVSVPPVVQFYFVGTFGDRANLELHRWIHGQWLIVPSAPSLLGAPVEFIRSRAKLLVPGTGEEVAEDVNLSPGVLLLDVIKDFPYQPSGGNRPIRTNVLVYADQRGAVLQRIEWQDRTQATDDRLKRKEVVPAAPTKGGRAPAK
jgi:hypothetical protein